MPDRYYLRGRDTTAALFPRTFVFDANIWLSISGPFEDEVRSRATAYSRFYRDAVEKGSTIIVPQLVATEFLNRSVYILASEAGYKREQCKIHRAQGYSEWIKEACDLLNAIVDGNTRAIDHFDSVDLEACFQSAERGGLEFHDVMLVAFCQRNGHILVTDDADFTDQNIPVVTWNARLK